MRTIEFTLIILIAAFSSGCVLQIPPEPQREYTIILLPASDSAVDSRNEEEKSGEDNLRGQPKHDSQATSGNLSEPHLHPVELLIER
jgi:hypothetical protein